VLRITSIFHEERGGYWRFVMKNCEIPFSLWFCKFSKLWLMAKCRRDATCRGTYRSYQKGKWGNLKHGVLWKRRRNLRITALYRTITWGGNNTIYQSESISVTFVHLLGGKSFVKFSRNTNFNKVLWLIFHSFSLLFSLIQSFDRFFLSSIFLTYQTNWFKR
jgi:hypothetical protein